MRPTQTLWLRGGIIGGIFCIGLFLFDAFIYFPVISSIYDGNLPDNTLIFPTLTGHFFFFFYGMINPGGFLCDSFGSMSICSHVWEMIERSGIAFLLVAAYFGVGALIGIVIQKTKKKNVN